MDIINSSDTRLQGWIRHASAITTLGFSLAVLSACKDVLEVEITSELTDEVLETAASAQTLVASVITHFEDSYNDYVWLIHGREEGGEYRLSAGGWTHGGYSAYPVATTGTVFQGMATSLRFAAHLHDKLTNEWTDRQIPQRGRYLAISSIYSGTALGVFGDHLCEVAVSGGPLITRAQTLAKAEEYLTRALNEIGAAGGDFAVPYGVASSAQAMAYGLRARVRWMAGDTKGALADAQRLPRGFRAFVTRGVAAERRNKPYFAGSFAGYHEVYDVIDWWTGLENPVTGRPWPKPIPFTGYRNLGILPDGRAVREDGLPIRTQGQYRTAVEDAAVRDTRVNHILGRIQAGPAQGYRNARYKAEDDPIPLVNWKEMWLVRAEIEGGQAAINLVNELRAADGLPLVSYANPNNAQQIRYMIIEERRRALYLEARFYPMKLRNPDLLWFPRAAGHSPGVRYELQGGVTFLMPDSEYDLNGNMTLANRGTGCDPAIKPVRF